MTNEDKVRELSRRFAEMCGLPIPHDKAPAGELHDRDGRLVWQWYKCARHNTWLQPCFCDGVSHWHCKVDGCRYVRAAKFRSWVERALFGIYKAIEEAN